MIAFDASSVGLAGGASGPLNITHVCTGSNTLLFVGCFATTGDVVTGITYNGVSMTQVGKVTNGGETTYLYYLIAPASGSNTIAISWTGVSTVRGHGVSYTGCAQSGVPDANTTNSNSGSAITTTLTTIADNCWTVLYCRAQGNITAGAGTTLRGSSTTSNPLDSNSVITPAGSTSLIVNSSSSGTNGTVMASFAPATSGGNFFRMF